MYYNAYPATVTAINQVEVRPQVARGEGHLAVLREFIATIRSGEWAGHHGEDGLRRAQIIEACYASAQAGREVTIARRES